MRYVGFRMNFSVSEGFPFLSDINFVFHAEAAIRD
jgi:hypothetical protein